MSFEREVEHLRQQLLSIGSSEGSLHQLEKSRESVPDMEHAINILKRSSLEVELAAKEKEVATHPLFVTIFILKLMFNRDFYLALLFLNDRLT